MLTGADGSAEIGCRAVSFDIRSNIVIGMIAATILHDARTRHGVSQRALAIRAGTSQAWISRIEAGQVDPSLESLRRLLLSLGEDLQTAASPLPAVDLDDGHRRHWRALSPSERLEQAVAWMALGHDLHGRLR